MREVFTDGEKISNFDELAAGYYDRNFGSMSKSDVDLMMFKFYFERLISENRLENGIIDYSGISDYRIAKDLGITEARARSLKVRYHLKYGDEFDWKKAFATLISKARYDKNSKKVVVNIPDPNLFREIENYFDESGAYIEKQLNSKLLTIRAEYFLALAIETEPEKTKKEIIKEIRKSLKKPEKDELKLDIGKTLIDSGCDITTIAANVASMISSASTITIAIINLLKGV